MLYHKLHSTTMPDCAELLEPQSVPLTSHLVLSLLFPLITAMCPVHHNLACFIALKTSGALYKLWRTLVHAGYDFRYVSRLHVRKEVAAVLKECGRITHCQTEVLLWPIHDLKFLSQSVDSTNSTTHSAEIGQACKLLMYSSLSGTNTCHLQTTK